MIQSPTSLVKRFPTFFLAGLVVVIFVLTSCFAIKLIEAQKVPTFENDTAWLVSYFERNQSRKLSEKQIDIIQNSTAITTPSATDAGVTVTLQSVCGNGYINVYKVEVELPEALKEDQQCFFEKQKFQGNDKSMFLGSSRFTTEILDDSNPTDNRFSLVIKTGIKYYPGFFYSFDNGIIRTFCLENLRIQDEDGLQSKLIVGKWELGVLFRNEGKVTELIQEPVIVRGFDLYRESYYEVEVTSFALTEFSASCQYKTLRNPLNGIVDVRPVIVMKDGRTVFPAYSGGGDQSYYWDLRVPISLDEVAFVKLSDEVFLPVQAIRK